MDALILVDLQNDFMPGGALEVPQGGRVVPVANRLMPRFECVVATRDWHPADHCSFAGNHPGHRVGEVIRVGGLDQILWPKHCIQETHGASFQSDLNRAGIHHIVDKGMNPLLDSYSGFFDNGHMQETGLGDFLKAQGVTRVAILGLATDYCVRHTALDAVQLGFETLLIPEGCRAVNLNPDDGEQAIKAMQDSGIRMVSCEDF